MAAAHTARGTPSRPPLPWPGVVLGWFSVGEQATGGSRGGHSGLSSPVTRANRRQQHGIGCTSTCQRINADTHSTTTRPLNHSTHHSSALREIDTLRRDDAGAVRSETPRPGAVTSDFPLDDGVTPDALFEIKRVKTTGRHRRQTANSPGRGKGKAGGGGVRCCSSSSGAQAARPKESRPLTAGPSVSPMVSSQCLTARPA